MKFALMEIVRCTWLVLRTILMSSCSLLKIKGPLINVNNEGLTPSAFLNEYNMKKLDLIDRVVSLNKRVKIHNNDGLLVKGTKAKETGEVFLMHSFGKMVDHVRIIFFRQS